MSSPALSNVLLPGTVKAGLFAQGQPADPWPSWDGSPTAASTGLVHAATSSQLHERVAVNSVTGAMFPSPQCPHAQRSQATSSCTLTNAPGRGLGGGIGMAEGIVAWSNQVCWMLTELCPAGSTPPLLPKPWQSDEVLVWTGMGGTPGHCKHRRAGERGRAGAGHTWGQAAPAWSSASSHAEPMPRDLLPPAI